MERPMAAVKALVEKQDRILTLEVDAGEEKITTLPGGRVEHGESPLEALHREVKEEVSLEIEPGKPVGMYHFFIGGEPDGEQVVLTVFPAEITGGEVDIDSNPADEAVEDFHWMSPGEFMESNANPGLKNLVRQRCTGNDLPKLVRNHIPEIIRENGEEPTTKELTDERVLPYVRDKIVEEAEEFADSADIEELADLLETIDRYLELEEFEPEAIQYVMEQKNSERGGFSHNVVLEDVE